MAEKIRINEKGEQSLFIGRWNEATGQMVNAGIGIKHNGEIWQGYFADDNQILYAR